MKRKALLRNYESQFCFRQWTNKPYGAFNSMHRHIKIGVLSAVYFLVFSVSQSVCAQSDTTARAQALEEITVNALKEKMSLQTMRVSSVITKEDIAKLPAQSIQDVLASIAAIDVRSRGTEGVQADISIRGGGFDQVLILLNGINITDPQTGHLNFNIPISLNAVERIEVLQGANARTLGANAFSGAINIVTKESKENNLKANLSGGSFGYFNADVVGTLQAKQFSFLTSVSHKQSDGYKKNTDFNISDYYLQAQFKPSKAGVFTWQGAFQNKAFAANGFYHPAFQDQYEYTRTFFSSLHWTKQINNIQYEASTFMRRSYDRFELIHDSSYGRNHHRTDVAGAQAKMTFYTSIGKTSAGAAFRSEKIVSTSLGTPLSDPFDVAFSNDISPTPQYKKGDSRNMIDAFANHTIITGRFTTSAGLLYSIVNDFSNHLYAGIDESFRLNNTTKIFAGINQSRRLPTFTDIYYVGPGYTANTSIQPEEALNYELGVKYETVPLTANATIFYRQGKNIIDWTKSLESDPWKSSNHTRLNTAGAQFFAQYKLNNKIVKQIHLDALWQKSDKEADNFISKYALDYLKYKINLGLDHEIVKNLLASWRFLYEQRAGSYVEYPAGKTVSFEPVTLLDVKLQYALPHFAFYAQATNLLNKTYMDLGNLPLPGRWIKAGISYQLN